NHSGENSLIDLAVPLNSVAAVLRVSSLSAVDDGPLLPVSRKNRCVAERRSSSATCWLPRSLVSKVSRSLWSPSRFLLVWSSLCCVMSVTISLLHPSRIEILYVLIWLASALAFWSNERICCSSACLIW